MQGSGWRVSYISMTRTTHFRPCVDCDHIHGIIVMQPSCRFYSVTSGTKNRGLQHEYKSICAYKFPDMYPWVTQILTDVRPCTTWYRVSYLVYLYKIKSSYLRFYNHTKKQVSEKKFNYILKNCSIIIS